MEKPDLVNQLVLDFLENDPPKTFMPLRRQSALTTSKRRRPVSRS